MSKLPSLEEIKQLNDIIDFIHDHPNFDRMVNNLRKKPTVHMISVSNANSMHPTVCGQFCSLGNIKFTNNEADVTCEKCLKMLK